MKPIKSSMATHAGYDPATQAMSVTFTGGATHVYRDVPPNIGETVVGAKSFGSAFNRHVAGKYSSSKIEKPHGR